MGVFGL